MKGKFELIEAGRGAAALCVVLMHAANMMAVPHFSGHIGMGGFFNFGYVGVDFFFVLSGFVICHAHLRGVGQAERIPRYLWRRAARIYPIFWFSLALAAVVTLGGRWVLGKGTPLDFSWSDVLPTLLLVPMGEPKLLGVAWSLQYEVMFYTLFALAMLHRRAMALLLALWAAGLALRMAGIVDATLAGLLTGHTMQFVMGGTVAAWAQRRGPAAHPRVWFALSMLGMTAAVLMERHFWLPHGEPGRVALGLSSAATIYALMSLDMHGHLRPPRSLVMLGSVSYSVYLNHITFIGIIYSLMRVTGAYHTLPEALTFGIAVTGAVLASSIIGLWVELPLVERVKEWRSRTAAKRT